MKLALFTAICLAFVVVAFSFKCQHNDPTGCNMNCTDTGMEVGCEHEICTCVMAAISCQLGTDCSTMTCEHHDENPHCFDYVCKCMKDKDIH